MTAGRAETPFFSIVLVPGDPATGIKAIWNTRLDTIVLSKYRYYSEESKKCPYNSSSSAIEPTDTFDSVGDPVPYRKETVQGSGKQTAFLAYAWSGPSILLHSFPPSSTSAGEKNGYRYHHACI